MEYNEEKALALIERHGLSQKTNKVWKTRGKIPERYADDTYVIPERIEGKKAKRLNEVLSNEKINLRELTKAANVDYYILGSFRKGETRLIESDYVKLKGEINNTRIAAKKLIDVLMSKQFNDETKNDKLKDFCTDYRSLVISVLLDKKALNLRNNLKVLVTYEDHMRYADRLGIFVLETSL